MNTNGDSLVSRVRSSFQHLSSRAGDLNALSDQVGKVIARFDAEFSRLNIGIEAWIPFETSASEDGLHYSKREIGYAKIGSKWGLAIRDYSGNEASDAYDDYQEWLFNDAPRQLRLQAIELIPELFDKLVAEVDRATKRVDRKLKELEELASALDPLPTDSAPLPNTVELFTKIGKAANARTLQNAMTTPPNASTLKRPNMMKKG